MRSRILRKLCACLFCFCPNFNYYEKQTRQIEIIYSQIRCGDNIEISEEFV